MQRLVRTAFLWLILLPLPVQATTPVQPPEDTAAASPAAAAPKADPQLPWVTRQADVPRVSFHRFHSAVAGTDVSYHLYTPLEYDQFPDRRFPVLYWLHGTEGGINHIRPVARLFHFGIRDHGLPPLLVVFVNGLSKRLWTDSKDGRAPIESVFIRDLIPQIDQSLRTIAGPHGRILEGFSMGGYGAARIGFQHPELFGGISILAAGPLSPEFEGPRANGNPLRDEILRDVCSSDMQYFRATHPWNMAQQNAAQLRHAGTIIRQATGTSDFSLTLNRTYHEHLQTQQIPHEYHEVPNVAHDTPALLAGLANAQFYRKALTPRPPAKAPAEDSQPSTADSPQ